MHFPTISDLKQEEKKNPPKIHKIIIIKKMIITIEG